MNLKKGISVILSCIVAMGMSTVVVNAVGINSDDSYINDTIVADKFERLYDTEKGVYTDYYVYYTEDNCYILDGETFEEVVGLVAIGTKLYYTRADGSVYTGYVKCGDFYIKSDGLNGIVGSYVCEKDVPFDMPMRLQVMHRGVKGVRVFIPDIFMK